MRAIEDNIHLKKTSTTLQMAVFIVYQLYTYLKLIAMGWSVSSTYMVLIIASTVDDQNNSHQSRVIIKD